MKCIKCRTVNVHNANYCKKCAYEFSSQEQEAAEKRTFIGFLKRIDKIKSNVMFEKITGHIAFKVGTILGVLCIGISFMLTNGTDFSIAESDSYTTSYNEKLNEYYLYSDKDVAELSLYIPKKVDTITIKHFDENNIIIGDIDYKVNDNIVLYGNGNKDYYILEVNYSNDKTEKIKLFIYQDKDGE